MMNCRVSPLKTFLRCYLSHTVNVLELSTAAVGATCAVPDLEHNNNSYS